MDKHFNIGDKVRIVTQSPVTPLQPTGVGRIISAFDLPDSRTSYGLAFYEDTPDMCTTHRLESDLAAAQ